MVLLSPRQGSPHLIESSLIPSSLAPFLDGRFTLAALIAFVAGFVRGFSGFGAGMVYVPLIGALYGPRFAVVSLLIVDFICAVPYVAVALPHVRWRETLPLLIGCALALPLGALALIYVDPTPLRWAIAIIIVIFVVLLASGWRYHGQPKTPVTLGVGAISGALGGATQIPGPPVIIYWLGGQMNALTVRANLIAYFGLCDLFSIIVYGASGLLTNEPIFFGLAMIVPYIAGAGAGSLLFAFISDANYRVAAYVIILFAAISSLPLFDRLLR
jgi:uncharacterized membrane protein YfcA